MHTSYIECNREATYKVWIDNFTNPREEVDDGVVRHGRHKSQTRLACLPARRASRHVTADIKGWAPRISTDKYLRAVTGNYEWR
jgi:hypothetical protein